MWLRDGCGYLIILTITHSTVSDYACNELGICKEGVVEGCVCLFNSVCVYLIVCVVYM